MRPTYRRGFPAVVRTIMRGWKIVRGVGRHDRQRRRRLSFCDAEETFRAAWPANELVADIYEG